MKITPKQYQEFIEHLMWQRLQTPDYRMGQAFLNYFPDISTNMANSKEGTLLEMKLYYETDEEREIAQGSGGYARPMPESWMKRQAALVHERAKQADIIITTALIPGRKAPILISEETVKAMKPGSVIVDMAVEQGGNCPLSELGKTVTKYGVHIVGEANLAALVAADASALYARNLLDFLKLIIDKDGALAINLDDEIVAATRMCAGGEVFRK